MRQICLLQQCNPGLSSTHRPLTKFANPWQSEECARLDVLQFDVLELMALFTTSLLLAVYQQTAMNVV